MVAPEFLQNRGLQIILMGENGARSFWQLILKLSGHCKLLDFLDCLFGWFVNVYGDYGRAANALPHLPILLCCCREHLAK